MIVDKDLIVVAYWYGWNADVFGEVIRSILADASILVDPGISRASTALVID